MRHRPGEPPDTRAGAAAGAGAGDRPGERPDTRAGASAGEPPPFWGRWRRIYLFVAGMLVAEAIAFWVLTRWAS